VLAALTLRQGSLLNTLSVRPRTPHAVDEAAGHPGFRSRSLLLNVSAIQSVM
jgi:hypothetical protein